MPLRNTSIYPLPLTDAQKKTLAEVAGKGKQAEYIRALIAADCSAKGVAWPDDLVPNGKYQRKTEE